MRKLADVVVLVLGALCAALAIVILSLSFSNQKLQFRIQSQQQVLAGGLLGAQGQQIALSVVQDMTRASVTNARIRELLARHGYPVPSLKSESAAPAPASAPEGARP